MIQKRYKVVPFPQSLSPGDLQHCLNDHALHGWRLHSIRAAPPERKEQLIFERDWDSSEVPEGLR